MQQVNLYLTEFKPKREYFSANFSAISTALLMLLLIVMQAVMKSSIQKTEEQVVALENQKVATALQVDKLKNTPLGANAAQLDAQLAELDNELESREKLREIIEYQNLGNEQGFALVLAALARQSFDIIALERIKLSAGGQYIELGGKTRSAKAVPAYLQALQAEPALSNSRFGLLYIEQPLKQESRALSFSLGLDSMVGAAQ